MSKSQPKSVMVVDDDRLARRWCEVIIRRSAPEWQVVLVTSGSEALKRAEAEPMQAYLIDVNMPGLDGFQTARQLRDIVPRARIALLTGDSRPATIKQAAELGFHHLAKPVDPRALGAFLAPRGGRGTGVPAALLDHIDLGVISLDDSHTVAGCNQWCATHLAIRSDDVLRRPFAELLADGSGQDLLEAVATATDEATEVGPGDWFGRDVPLMARVQRISATGSARVLLQLRDVSDDLARQRSLERHTQELEVLLRDQQHQAQDLREKSNALAASNSDLEQFAYVASHDLQEPLRMVVSFLEMIAEECSIDDEAEQYLTYALEGATRMQGLVQGLLRFSRVTGGDGPLADVDLVPVLEEVLFNLRSDIDACEAEVCYPPTIPKVRGDQEQLVTLLQNLVANALEHRNEAPPRITLSAKAEGKILTLQVADNGKGIDPRHQRRIFEIFGRAMTGEKAHGSGVGLALCKRIVERHGGTIEVHSIRGHGSTFRLTLALAQELAEAV